LVIIKDFIPINEFSRCGDKLRSVDKIAIHYFGNHATTARQNVEYIKGLKNQDSTDNIKDTYASAHVFIDSTEIINCIPVDEIAYHVGSKNYTQYGLKISSWPNCRVLGVEMYHPTKTGKPDIMTLANTVVYCAEQCIENNLDPLEDICRHYDITGKICPKFYVDNPKEFILFKIMVAEEMDRIC
jgi:N-acetylmuramoyl-L-alanine amidase